MYPQKKKMQIKTGATLNIVGLEDLTRVLATPKQT